MILSTLTLAACSTGRAPEELTVLVYNIHAGKDDERRPNLDRVADLIRSTRAGLVLLQEVDVRTERSGRVDQLSELAAMTRLTPAFGKSLDYQGGEYGVAILSAFPIVAREVIPLRLDPPQPRAGGSLEPRVALRVKVEIEERLSLTILNTHLDASRDEVWRAQEIATLASVVRQGEPTLVGGDLNMTPDNALLESLDARSLRDAWGCGEGEGETYPASAPVKRIDYLYFSPDFECISATVLGSDASDHRPLLVKLRVRR